MVEFVQPGPDKSPVKPKTDPQIGVALFRQAGVPALHIICPFIQYGELGAASSVNELLEVEFVVVEEYKTPEINLVETPSGQ